MSTMTDKMNELGVYCEKSFNGNWCYKFEFPGQDVIIVSHKDKEKAASNFFIEYLKSIHYSIKYLITENLEDELKSLLDELKAKNDENIDKTVEIAMRYFRPNTQPQ